MDKIKVLVVDDSMVIRQLLKQMINAEPDMEVVGTAADPIIARDKIKQLNPDVITLDIEMPRMDGITFLRNLMRLRPMPVVMISTLTEAGAAITMEALDIGAFDFVPKPKENLGKGLESYAADVTAKLRASIQANLGELERRSKRSSSDRPKAILKVTDYAPRAGQIIAIGASTGGTEAIKDVLMGLPANCPPVVITQHIPERFSASYAARMNSCCSMTVHEAENNQKLMPGHAYIARGGYHLTIKKVQGGYVTHIDEKPPVNRHRPSVEVLFDSVIACGLKNTVAVMLTGMGADGSEAMLRMKEFGCYTIIQDENSSVVWGMPGVAFKLGAHCEVKALHKISKRLLDLTNRRTEKLSRKDAG
ncbi:chemotaxis response regulator protein-glutamate methylesterase [Gammaproteobacteria bacterium 45_16_T64]|nr:chemotaxis response regulator protein-glutamate methylesterase [Gammaproteobacteria bacterium 45_16_T64]